MMRTSPTTPVSHRRLTSKSTGGSVGDGMGSTTPYSAR